MHEGKQPGGVIFSFVTLVASESFFQERKETKYPKSL